MPLLLHEYDAVKFDGGCLAYLGKAENVAVTENMDRPHTLTFDYPLNDEKADMIQEYRIVSVNGQGYRLTNVTRDYSDTRYIKATATHVFFEDAQCTHLPTIGNDKRSDVTIGIKPYTAKSTIGVDPYVVISEAVKGTKFELIPDSELEVMEMKRIGADGVKIDFFPTDKINVYDVVRTVIESYGRGEIYLDNYRFAVVERIGKDNGVRMSLKKNLTRLSIQRDTAALLTRVYPYGKDDLTISSVNGGVPYIESTEAVKKYGVREGYFDYSDYTDPAKVKARAEYDLMGEDNDNRVDTPTLTIMGDVVDLSKLAEYGDFYKIALGDTVHVHEQDIVHHKRIINITYYPFSAKQPAVTIGYPEIKNAFNIAWQEQQMLRTVLKNSTKSANAKLKTGYFYGTLNSTQNPVKSENEKLLLDGDCLVINDPVTNERRLELGNVDGQFTLNIYSEDGNTLKIKLGDHGSNGGENYAFAIYDNKGKASIYMDENGEVYFAGKLETLKNASIGQELLIGAIDESISRILFQGETNASEIINDDINKIFKISPSFGGDLVIDENGITFDGSNLLTSASIRGMRDDISKLKERVLKLENG